MKNNITNIQLVLLDVDGVLTDGSIIYSDSGEQIKKFNSRDGLGIRLLMDADIKVGIVTGRVSNALHHRCKNLSIDLIFDGIKDKAAVLSSVEDRTGIKPDEIGFIGDDLIDLPIMRRVGTSFCVSDACDEVKQEAFFISHLPGGKGAVREICEYILKEKGLWENALNRFLS